jgi:MOSC domain-containing protein YiiM
MKRLLSSLFTKNHAASLQAIYISGNAGEKMQSVNSVYAVTDKGLQGDRYFNRTGYWDPVEGCQVTLITEHDLKLARRGNQLKMDQGQHRRNLVISGIKISRLKDRQFQLGEAIFEYQKPRPPCGYLNQIEGKGMAKALSYNSGICIKVIRSGTVRTNDQLIIL